MNVRHLSYSPIFSAFLDRCVRLRNHIRAHGRDVAAFHAPSQLLGSLDREAGQELRNLTIFGRPVYAHQGSGGIIAEKGRRLEAPPHTIRWRDET